MILFGRIHTDNMSLLHPSTPQFASGIHNKGNQGGPNAGFNHRGANLSELQATMQSRGVNQPSIIKIMEENQDLSIIAQASGTPG